MKPPTVTIRDREVPVCSHASCEAHRIWDYSTCAEHLTLSERQQCRERLADKLRAGGDLSSVVLSGLDLSELDFSGANLSKAFLDYCNLSKCRFVDSDLKAAYLGWSKLDGADLTRAELHGTVFTQATLNSVKLVAYAISFGRKPVNLTSDSFRARSIFGSSRIDEEQPLVAEATYRALKAIFVDNGDHDSASWASFRERRMNRKNLWSQRRYVRWFGSVLFGVTTGYGERPARIVACSCGLVLLFAYLYASFGLLEPHSADQFERFGNALYFSVATFCTFSAPLVIISNTAVAKALVALEAFVGMFTMGLFIFTLTRRYVAR